MTPSYSDGGSVLRATRRILASGAEISETLASNAYLPGLAVAPEGAAILTFVDSSATNLSVMILQ